MVVHERDVENRKRGITMHRRWVQASILLPFLSRTLHNVPRPLPQAVFQLREPAEAPCLSSAARRLTDEAMADVDTAPVAGSWLVGAAGRLASLARAGPLSLPSGRATLPASLDSADEMASALSPLVAGSKRGRDELMELEREFFETIGRDAEVRKGRISRQRGEDPHGEGS